MDVFIIFLGFYDFCCPQTPDQRWPHLNFFSATRASRLTLTCLRPQIRLDALLSGHWNANVEPDLSSILLSRVRRTMLLYSLEDHVHLGAAS